METVTIGSLARQMTEDLDYERKRMGRLDPTPIILEEGCIPGMSLKETNQELSSRLYEAERDQGRCYLCTEYMPEADHTGPRPYGECHCDRFTDSWSDDSDIDGLVVHHDGPGMSIEVGEQFWCKHFGRISDEDLEERKAYVQSRVDYYKSVQLKRRKSMTPLEKDALKAMLRRAQPDLTFEKFAKAA